MLFLNQVELFGGMQHFQLTESDIGFKRSWINKFFLSFYYLL